MKPQQQNEPQTPPDSGTNYIALAVACLSLSAELTLHNPFTFGIRSVGPRAAGTLLLMWVFGLCYTSDNRTPLLAFTALIAALSVIARISAMIRERRGKLCHSRYNGRPWALTVLPISELRMKLVESWLLILGGWGLHHLNVPLGSFVMASAACYSLRTAMEHLANRTRTLDFTDALTEQTIAMQAMRRVRRR
jgi:hypothetical protein